VSGESGNEWDARSTDPDGAPLGTMDPDGTGALRHPPGSMASRRWCAFPPVHPGLPPAFRPIRPNFLLLIGLCRKQTVGIKCEPELKTVFQRFNAAA
jgi:hypothetical protein